MAKKLKRKLNAEYEFTKFLATIVFVSFMVLAVLGILLVIDVAVNQTIGTTSFWIQVALSVLVLMFIIGLMTLISLVSKAPALNAKKFKDDIKYLGYVFEPTMDDYVVTPKYLLRSDNSFHLHGIGWVKNEDENGRNIISKEHSDLFHAFINYGHAAILVKLTNEKIGENSSNRRGWNMTDVTKSQLFKSLLVEHWLMRSRKLDPSVNPIPLAAYLFRFAGTRHKPWKKKVRETALLLWEQQRKLQLCHDLHNIATPQAIKDLEGFPETWVREALIPNYSTPKTEVWR